MNAKETTTVKLQFTKRSSLFSFLCLGIWINILSAASADYRSGDIVFVAKSGSAFESAIVGVTQTENRDSFSHNGLINVTDSGVYVIEATPSGGVVYTPIDIFFEKNGKENIYRARLQPIFERYIPEAIEYACSLLGKKYDFAFDLENDQYYCSELIYVAFANASKDAAFFELPPMTFKDPATNDFLPYWIDYYKKLETPIPEGKPGLNPNGMSLSDKLIWIQ